jgi:galactose mutarotase-like enzyme
MIILDNDTLRAKINLHGAELCSLIRKETNSEYIWQADPTFWARHSPVLFPIVGKLRNDEYVYQGNQYNMSQHGFARDFEFELMEQRDVFARFMLKGSRETRIVYPFKFELYVNYLLEDETIRIDYEIKNKDHHDLLFSIGGHPAFKCPVFDHEQKTDYFIKFEKKENASRHLIESGIRTGEVESMLKNEDVIAITDGLFDRDALIFTELESKSVSLCTSSGPRVAVYFDQMPYLGIWSKSDEAPFICIEPWHGIADRIDHNQKLENKEGIIKLEPRETFQTGFSIQVHH